MAGQNLEVPKFLDAVSLGANSESVAINAREQFSGIFHLVWSGASATDAVVKVQESGDKTNWKDISGASATIAAASGTAIIRLTPEDLLAPNLRLVVVKNTETTGTVTAGYFLKGNR